MNDNDFRRSTSPRRSSKKQVIKPKGRSVIAVQTVICIVLLIAAISLKFFGGAFFITAKSYTKEVFKDSLTTSDVAQVFNNFVNMIPDTSSGNSSSNRSGSNTSSKKTTSNSTSSASSSSQSGSSNSSSSKASSSAASSTGASNTGETSSVADSLFVSSSGGGQGGEDISPLNTVSKAVATMLPPANCTLAPVMLSVKPIIPVAGRLTSMFGYRIHPVTKKLSFHTGIDIANDEGTPIAAALSGTIKDVGKSDAYGNYVLMDNGGGVETFYGHCEQVIAPKGAVVRAGDIIAKLGNTGISTGPHLHFEIRINNIYTNPLWNLKITQFSQVQKQTE
jgi:murein DD-endopeptidase MepM/ murein hydrolase activator NlpD